MTLPTPPQLRLAAGTHMPKRHGDAAAIEAEKRFEKVPPAPRSKGAEFKRRWKQYGEALVAVGILTERDLPCLELLCDAHQERADCERTIRKDGLFLETKYNGRKLHPAAVHRQRSYDLIVRLQKELCCTPMSRARTGRLQQKPGKPGRKGGVRSTGAKRS